MPVRRSQRVGTSVLSLRLAALSMAYVIFLRFFLLHFAVMPTNSIVVVLIYTPGMTVGLHRVVSDVILTPYRIHQG